MVLPSEIMFSTPIVGYDINSDESLMDYKLRLVKCLKSAHEIVYLKRAQCALEYKDVYDASQKLVEFEPNDLVMVYWPIPKKGLSQKLLPKWKGPYRIVRKLGNLTYRIEKDDRTTFTAHVQRLKKYRPFKQSNSNRI